MKSPVCLLVCVCLALVDSAVFAQPPRTVAERTNYQETGKNADVIDYCKDLAKQAPLLHLGELGTTHEGRKIPLAILADPPVRTPDEAARSGKLVVLAMG